MASPYTHIQWFAFREKCLNRADYKCERCGKTGILQVHHPEYVSGRKPWEYEIAFCEVLCRGCHAAEHGLILPREGWIILHSDLDDGEPSDPVPCANCGLDVRWHFTIFHEQWGEVIVGSECAENLSLGPEVTIWKSYHRRKRTFVFSPRWTPSAKGYWILQDQVMVIAFRSGEKWRLKIDDKWGRFDYASLDDAKAKAFEVLEHRRRAAIE